MRCGKTYILSFKQKSKSLSSTDLSNIEEQGIAITYAQRIYPEVSNGFRSEEVSAFATNENYAYFTNTYLVKRAFFSEIQIERKLPLAVVNGAAAYQLFGNQECVGETVYLNGVPYKALYSLFHGRDEPQRDQILPLLWPAPVIELWQLFFKVCPCLFWGPILI